MKGGGVVYHFPAVGGRALTRVATLPETEPLRGGNLTFVTDTQQLVRSEVCFIVWAQQEL